MRRSKKYFQLSLLGMMAFVACNKDEQLTAPLATEVAVNGAPIPGKYIIEMKDAEGYNLSDDPEDKIAAVKKEANNLFAKHRFSNGKITRTFGIALKGFAADLTDEEVAKLRMDKNVKLIEPDRYIKLPDMQVQARPQNNATVASTQNTPWGITRVGGAGGGLGRTAWIVDTGIDLDHPDLNVNISRSRSFLPTTSSADDGHGHGSHVAGTVAARNNSFGVVGVAPDAALVSLRVLDNNGSGQFSYSISAFDYIAARAKAGDVVNYSVGPTSRYVSQTLDNAVLRLASRGIKFIMAAGNSSDNVMYYSPARLSAANVFVVSAIDNTNTYAPFSNYGSTVNYAAPGVAVLSTYKDGMYATMSGTSMASPHVAGILAAQGTLRINGYALSDPDGKADPIAHK